MKTQKKLLLSIISMIACVMSASAISLSEAQSLSKESGKNIFVNYSADWCLPCQIFKDGTMVNPKVQDLVNNEFVVLDADTLHVLKLLKYLNQPLKFWINRKLIPFLKVRIDQLINK